MWVMLDIALESGLHLGESWRARFLGLLDGPGDLAWVRLVGETDPALDEEPTDLASLVALDEPGVRAEVSAVFFFFLEASSFSMPISSKSPTPCLAASVSVKALSMSADCTD